MFFDVAVISTTLNQREREKFMTHPMLKQLPGKKSFQSGIRRAPKRNVELTSEEKRLALKNALRYIPVEHHGIVAPEFLEELETMGRIYGYRYRPEGKIWGKPIDQYPGILEARALQVNVDNNLDFEVALYPYELVTYGETGQVCQNWMQYLMIMDYLGKMTEEQTLVIASGHPYGLFKSHRMAPRVVSTNAALVGNWDDADSFNKLAALGVSNYGQMTAGGWIYIGPQGIVHGTYLTLLNAGRLYLGIPEDENLAGVVFVSSGLGGMSSAQAKAIEIAGGVGVIAEVDESRIKTRLDQRWISLVSDDLEQIAVWIEEYRTKKEPISIAYHGNVVTLLQFLHVKNIRIDLLSDQTSCHVVYEGGYTPAGIGFDEGRELIQSDLKRFKSLVNESLTMHYEVIKSLVERGTRFFDYGNSFMASVLDAGVKEIARNGFDVSGGFIWPSYVEDLMGPICFDKGFGPYRWVCSSRKDSDLEKTDQAALELIDPSLSSLHRDNYQWIKNAGANDLVVGTKCRILYSDEKGRVELALKFNEMVRNGEVGPIVIGRDHHDTMGTDSPLRETANIYDGSRFTADMAEHNFAGNVRHGMTLAVRSNGGGVGVGRAVNCGYALVLDGSKRVDTIIMMGVSFDVAGGIARRSWAGNSNALETAMEWNCDNTLRGEISIPHLADDEYLKKLVS